MTAFKKTVKPGIYSKPRDLTTDGYWNKLGVPLLIKEFGTIDYIDFSPIEPHYFAVTCSVRVQLYNPITRNVVKNLNKFRENAYGGAFRSDGLLLVAGGEEGVVRLFDVSSKTLMRVFKGHTGAVHRTFFTSDKTHLVSFSDDKTVSTWDIPCETRLQTFSGHTDYIRAGAVSPVSPTVLLSGSYDGTVRMYDHRTQNDAVFTVNHGAPVESVIFLPSGGIFLSAGGTEIRVWDAFAGGRMLTKMSHHHKTVTSLCLTSDGTRLFSGSLDRHVKVYSVSSYQPMHTFDYPNAVLSLGISPNDETLVAGMVDGIISVRRRETEIVETEKQKKKTANYRFAGDNYRLNSHIDILVPSTNLKETQYDKMLRKFEYSKAFNALMVKYNNPDIVVAVLQELNRRKGLHQAVAGCKETVLSRLLTFLIKFLGDYRFTRTLIDVANILLDVYEDQLDDLSPSAQKLLKDLAIQVKRETELTLKLATLQGALHMILAASSTKTTQPQQSTVPTLEPTAAAMEPMVYNVS